MALSGWFHGSAWMSKFAVRLESAIYGFSLAGAVRRVVVGVR
jgi:hypothetical protein